MLPLGLPELIIRCPKRDVTNGPAALSVLSARGHIYFVPSYGRRFSVVPQVLESVIDR
jgi:hypothetical protein